MWEASECVCPISIGLQRQFSHIVDIVSGILKGCGCFTVVHFHVLAIQYSLVWLHSCIYRGF